MLKRIAIFPFPALGDETICLRLAQNLTNSGFEVTLFTNMLVTSQVYLNWLKLKALPDEINDVVSEFDLVMLDVLAPWVQNNLDKIKGWEKILLFTAKAYPKELPPKTFLNINSIDQTSGQLINRAFYLKKYGNKSMVECVDEYSRDIFGVESVDILPTVSFSQDLKKRERVIIFPTTPNRKKNYSLKGFNKLAYRLSSDGMKVEFVVMPHEEANIKTQITDFTVRSFADVAQLIEYLRSAKIVISNDSGGGHLAAMLGIPTITITRKNKNFIWRPGYELGNVVSPLFTLKFGGEHIWRPFISLKTIQKITKNILINN